MRSHKSSAGGGNGSSTALTSGGNGPIGTQGPTAATDSIGASGGGGGMSWMTSGCGLGGGGGGAGGGVAHAPSAKTITSRDVKSRRRNSINRKAGAKRSHRRTNSGDGRRPRW